MERKRPGNLFRKFGYTSRGCSLFWKCRKIVITGVVNRKMLFHSLLEVAGNSNRKFWLIGKRPKCTKTYNARAELLFLLIKPIVLWRSRCRRRRRCSSSLFLPFCTFESKNGAVTAVQPRSQGLSSSCPEKRRDTGIKFDRTRANKERNWNKFDGKF